MNLLDHQTALRLIQILLGTGLAVQSLEGWLSRSIYDRGGAWGLDSHGGRPQQLFGGRSNYGGGFMGLLFATRLMAGCLLCTPWVVPVGLLAFVVQLFLLVGSAFLVIRTGGPLCGGSDSMFFQLQLGLFVAAAGFVSPPLVAIGLAWIAAHSVLSYFLAGVAKARSRRWWNGEAIQNLLRTCRPYAVWSPMRAIASGAKLFPWTGVFVVLFELAAPAVLVIPPGQRMLFLILGFLFHLGIAVALGLNRFFWAWISTYPALLVF